MEAEDLLLNEEISNIETVHSNGKKERLYQLVATGKSGMYLGKSLTVEEVQSFTPEEIDHYYTRYQSVFGARMSKSIGKSLISIYTKAFNYFFKVKYIDYLSDDLMNDPIVSNTIGSISCELYYRFGNLLGPVAVALISANHVDFSSLENGERNNPERRHFERRNSENEGEESGKSDYRKKSW
jgi:hypothetical protein